MTGRTTVIIDGQPYKVKFGNYVSMSIDSVYSAKYGELDRQNMTPTIMFQFVCILVFLGLENQAILEERSNTVTYSQVLNWADDASLSDLMAIFEVFTESKTVGSLAKDIQANLPKDKTAKKK